MFKGTSIRPPPCSFTFLWLQLQILLSIRSMWLQPATQDVVVIGNATPGWSEGHCVWKDDSFKEKIIPPVNHGGGSVVFGVALLNLVCGTLKLFWAEWSVKTTEGLWSETYCPALRKLSLSRRSWILQKDNLKHTAKSTKDELIWKRNYSEVVLKELLS